MTRSILALCLGIPCLGLSSAFAQVLSGEPKPDSQEDPFPWVERYNVYVETVRLTGNQVIPTEELLPLTRKVTGRSVSLADLQALADEITALYRRRGYFLAKAYVPVQSVVQYEVEIRIREGVVESIRPEGNRFYSTSALLWQLSPILREGPLRYQTLEHSLRRLNEYPDLSVRTILEPGKEPDTTALVLAVEDARPLHATVEYNNFGSRLAGRDRAVGQLFYGDLLGLTDQLSLSALADTEGDLVLFGATYDVPVTSTGTRTGISYRELELEVAGEFDPLELEGTSKSAGLYVRHPAWKMATFGLGLETGVTYKKAETRLLNLRSARDRLGLVHTGASMELIDQVGGKNVASLFAHYGVSLANADSERRNPEQSRPAADRHFVKWTLEYARVQPAFWGSLLVGRALAQYSANNLTVVEQFSIGGANSVRGYPPGEFLGDNGYSGSLELRFPPYGIGNVAVPWERDKFLWDVLQLVVFVDAGGTQIHEKLPGERGNEHLWGAGAGLRWELPYSFSLRLDWGVPMDQDPSDNRNGVAYFSLAKTVF